MQIRSAAIDLYHASRFGEPVERTSREYPREPSHVGSWVRFQDNFGQRRSNESQVPEDDHVDPLELRAQDRVCHVTAKGNELARMTHALQKRSLSR